MRRNQQNRQKKISKDSGRKIKSMVAWKCRKYSWKEEVILLVKCS